MKYFKISSSLVASMAVAYSSSATYECSNLMQQFADNNFADFPGPASDYKIKYKTRQVNGVECEKASVVCKKAKRSDSEEEKEAFDFWQLMNPTSAKRGLYKCENGVWVNEWPIPECPNTDDAEDLSFTKVNWSHSDMWIDYYENFIPYGREGCSNCLGTYITSTTWEDFVLEVEEMCRNYAFVSSEEWLNNNSWFTGSEAPDYITWWEDKSFSCVAYAVHRETFEDFNSGIRDSIYINFFQRLRGPISQPHEHYVNSGYELHVRTSALNVAGLSADSDVTDSTIYYLLNDDFECNSAFTYFGVLNGWYPDYESVDHYCESLEALEESHNGLQRNANLISDEMTRANAMKKYNQLKFMQTGNEKYLEGLNSDSMVQ